MLPRLPFIAAIALAALPFVTVDAACLRHPDAEIQAFEKPMGIDPAQVVDTITARLSSVAPEDSVRRAAYYSVLAEAWAALEDPDQVNEATANGLALVSDKREITYLNLALTRAGNVMDDATSRVELANMEALRAAQDVGSMADACVLVKLGHLELQAGRLDQASIYATNAYRLSVGPERRRQRALAADVLSVIAREQHDHEQALTLNQEVIDWDTERGATFDLATSRFIRGSIYQDMGDHQAAIAELEAARSLTVRDPFGVAYNDVMLCRSNIELRRFARARQHCEQAVPVFKELQATSPLKLALQGLAKIDIAEGKPVDALVRLNQILDQAGRDLSGRQALSTYEMRSQVQADLGQHAKAYADLRTYLDRFKTLTQEDRVREAAALRAQFEMDRELERNANLQRELAIGQERLKAQTGRLQWMIAAATAGLCVIVLLTAMLVMNKRQKQLLVRLAEHDDLTNLPNRRRTIEVANEAFDRARREGRPVTIGIFDLDHFKRINDRYGHAVGDFVLQEFARIGRSLIREADVLGRWGGEEFLVVLPDTTLDVALGIVERIRQAVVKINAGALAEDMKVSLSAGLATNEGNPASLDEVVARADAALYDAKNGGRDLICVAPESYSVAATGIRKMLKQSGIELVTGEFERRVPGA